MPGVYNFRYRQGCLFGSLHRMKSQRPTPHSAAHGLSLGQRPPECKTFGDYRTNGSDWITLANGEYYPDVLPQACQLYQPVLVMFGQLLRQSATSVEFFNAICGIRSPWMRVQLARVFRKYVCPRAPVEMLKKKSLATAIVSLFGAEFRPITEVQRNFASRPMPDEALCAILWEYKDRGKKGYDLTERFFALLRSQLPHHTLEGPERAGKDVRMGSIWPDYPKPDRPTDFVVRIAGEVVAVGFARYDGDRGGSQEDDRTGGYRECVAEFLRHVKKKKLDHVKLVFLNDGPGLLLGSMWNDYADIEASGKGRIRVLTLRMVPERLTADWLES